ncbi:MAG: helix-turn-helix protein [Sphingomonadales bacterium]|jgi:transcriptional regulator with XRE-family HTH domain|nr:helix-turn-helix protein [Sphingomonadales bacterium]
MKTSQKLRRRRGQLGLTQSQVAAKAEMSTVQYNGYENARHEPSETTMTRLAKALKCRPDDLWDDDYVEDGQTLEDLKDALRKKAAQDLGLSPARLRVRIELV